MPPLIKAFISLYELRMKIIQEISSQNILTLDLAT